LIQYLLLIPIFLIIFFIPVEHEEEPIQIIAGTRTDWGYQAEWCDQFYSENTVEEHKTVTTWKKSYCSI